MRRKGEITGRQIDRDYPHQVEIAVPPGGLGRLHDAMYRFCEGIDHRQGAAPGDRLRRHEVVFQRSGGGARISGGVRRTDHAAADRAPPATVTE